MKKFRKYFDNKTFKYAIKRIFNVKTFLTESQVERPMFNLRIFHAIHPINE